MRGYAQLTLDQRYQIQECKRWKRRLKLSTIAARVGVSISTISRELKRNCTAGRGYRAKHAHNLALQRRETKSTPRIDAERWRQVEDRLREDWSPEQISLWQKKHRFASVSHESIYQYVYADKRTGGDLHKHLRCKKKRRKRYGTYKKRGHIVDRVSIDERAASVEKRLQIGHWELDTIQGKKQRCPIVTLVERKSRYTLIGQVSSNKADNVAKTIIRLLEPHAKKVKTLTSDNGKEFAFHKTIAQKLDAKFYFAHPYASWERALNENTNGLLRQYFPKNSDFSKLKQYELDHAMERLNNRPRKCLNMSTPNQIFLKTKQSVALGN